jgi:hypothetical protein
MSKRTPGPWVVYDDSKDGKTNRIEIAARGKTVARIYHSVPAEDLPNACLIAAAPELLDALKQALEECIWPNERLSDVHEKARAAIAKAEGSA